MDNTLYTKARETAAAFCLNDQTVLRLSGGDAADYLHRMSTSAIKTLSPGNAQQTLFLKGDGRLVADAIAVCVSPNEFLLITEPAVRDALTSQLDKFIVMEDVTLEDVSKGMFVIMLSGNRAGAVSESAKSASTADFSGVQTLSGEIAPKARRSYILGDRSLLSELKTRLTNALESAEGVWGDQQLLDVLRVEDGIPVFGKELTEATIPLEAGLKPAISFTKGCFPGQEIVARIENLGHPARTLVGLKITLESALSDLEVSQFPSCELYFEDKLAGWVTSTTLSPSHGFIGLGTVKWAYRDSDIRLKMIVGGTPAGEATVCELPFQPDTK